jgi:pyridoxine kinase
MSETTMSATGSANAVLTISSQVGRGSVGLRAAGFAIERLGRPVWKVPTIWMPWHPGHAKTFGVPPRHPTPDDVFEESLSALVGTPVIGEVGAVLTGYFASPGQVMATCRAIDAVRQVSPQVLVVCDPVSADSHGTYVPQEVVETLGKELLPRCDVVTPNRFEAAAFSGMEEADDNATLVAMARTLAVPRVVVTSAFGMMKNAIGTLLVEDKAATLAEHALVPGAPHGTGDLFSALLTAHLLSGMAPDKAMVQATASVFEMVARSVKAGSDELLIAQEQASLISPMAMVTTRHLAAVRARA